MANDNNDILTSQQEKVYFSRDYFIILGVKLKRQRCCNRMKRYKREKAEPFTLPTSPGILAGFYFTCGPVAGLGFWIDNLPGFLFAIAGDIVFWLLIVQLIKMTSNINVKQR